MFIDISKAKNVKNFGIEYGNLTRQSPYSTEWVYKMFNPEHQTPTAKDLQSRFSLIPIDGVQFIFPKDAAQADGTLSPVSSIAVPNSAAPTPTSAKPPAPEPVLSKEERQQIRSGIKTASKKVLPEPKRRGRKPGSTNTTRETPAKKAGAKKSGLKSLLAAPKKRGRKPGSVVVGGKVVPFKVKASKKAPAKAVKKAPVNHATGKRGRPPGSKNKK